MATSILALLATLIPFAIWLWKKRAAKKADPVEQHRHHYEKIDVQIARGNSDAATAGGNADLDELDRLQRADEKG